MLTRTRSFRLREATAQAAAPALARDTDAPEVDDAEGLTDENSVETMQCADCTDGLHDDGTVCDTCGGAGWGAVREAALSTAARKRIPKSDFVFPDKAPGPGSYPIPDRVHAGNALARSSGKPEEGAVKSAVYAKFPDMKTSESALRSQIAELGAQLDKVREGQSVALDRQDSPLHMVKTTDGRDGYEVVLIREGKGNTDDNHYYTRESVQDLVASGRAEGMQAYSNHPALDEEETLPERNVKDIVGTYADVRFAESDGKALANAILVPIKGPGYDWVQTLAEAASTHRGSKPLCGISLYGLSEGTYGDRPDGSYGKLVTRIFPTSADVVTNAGAGGEFVRRLMESARSKRALRETANRETTPMKVEDLKAKIRESAQRVREADTDEKRTAAIAEFEALASVEIDAPAPAATTIEALQESQPALVAQLRESATKPLADEVEALREQVREGQKTTETTASLLEAVGILREKQVPAEQFGEYLEEITRRGLRESEAITRYVDRELAREQRIRESVLAAVNDDEGLEGNPGRVPAQVADGGLSALRESGVPIKEPVAAAA